MKLARFSYPDEFREPAPERAYTGQIVTVLGPDNPRTADEEREAFGECLMRVQASDGHVLMAFETELEEVKEEASE
jgi:hypothetical protein